MRTERVLGVVAAALAIGLLAQIGFRAQEHREPAPMSATWRYNPASVTEAVRIADQIVLARVTAVDQTDGLRATVRGEPNNEVHIPSEAVTLAVEKTYMGRADPEVLVFHTGGTAVQDSAAPAAQSDTADGPLRRAVHLAEDPPYVVGERYLLFLMDGPALGVRGARTITKAVIAPQGRFRVEADNTLRPVTERGFANALSRQSLSTFETTLQTAVAQAAATR